jgi:2-methylisocitrate lyase-like PEP mutase family enzyme
VKKQKKNKNLGSRNEQKRNTRTAAQLHGPGGGKMPNPAAETAAQRLRRLVESPEILVAPGAQDALSAKLVERAGFHALFCGDYNAAAVLLGKPDYGFITLPEMVELLQRITRTVSIPLIGDAGCGFGNALNVYRTVQEYERVGVAGITIEDQVFPKRCGHMAGKQIIPADEMVAKLRAANRARRDPAFVICARTDAIATHGLNEAIARGRAYAKAGADLVWADAVPSREDIIRLVKEIPCRIFVALVEGGKTPLMTVTELERIGVSVVICGLMTLYATAAGIRDALNALRQDGSTKNFLDRMITFADFNALMGLPEIQKLEQQFATSGSSREGQ